MADPTLAPSPPDEEIAPEPPAAVPDEPGPGVPEHQAEASGANPSSPSSRVQDLVSAFDDEPEAEADVPSPAPEEGLASIEPTNSSAEDRRAEPQPSTSEDKPDDERILGHAHSDAPTAPGPLSPEISEATVARALAEFATPPAHALEESSAKSAWRTTRTRRSANCRLRSR